MGSGKGLVWRLLNPRSDLDKVSLSQERPQGRIRGRMRARDVVLNFPLMAGSLVVLGLFALVLFGPVWAPENPYVSGQHIVPHYDVQRRETIRPPLPPSAEYPLGTDRWGNDLLSLLMHGARNTLVACSFITMVRVLLGLALGALAGWNEGRPIDQIVMGAIGVTTSVPTLISSMILIYALDIRRGLPVFIVALSAIGWTEIAQYIRSEFLVLRKAPYIEGARGVGLNGLAIAVRHVLPNVLPQLLVISFLEMAAVMMLLGELGFVGVYIGGGSRISVETDPFVFEFRTLIEVPEWGAMLADGYRWLRSRPWVIMPPAVAFFVSVVGFNALGEGLRRLIERTSLSTAFLLRKRMLIVVVVLVVGTVFIINNTGPAPWFAKVAGAFNGKAAYEHVVALAAMKGRGAGLADAGQAATYIEAKFREYGLEPSWQGAEYVYPLPVRLVRPMSQPELSLLDADGTVLQSFRHQLDFGYVTEGHGGSGDVQARVAYVGFRRGAGDLAWESFKGMDLRDRVVLLEQGNAPPEFVAEALIRGARGVLWAVDDDRDAIRSQVRLDGHGALHALRAPQLSIFRIRPVVLEALLAGDGIAPADLGAQWAHANQSGEGWFVRDLGAIVRMSLTLGEPQEVDVPCVLGYKPGSDFDLAGELIVLFASYDGLGTDPDGTVYPAANHNASGVGVMLEMARLWHEQGLDARRSVLFVAWGGGQLGEPGGEAFLRNGTNFRHLPALTPNRPTMVVQLEGVGAGGEVLYLHPQSSVRLHELFSEVAAQVGVPVVSEQGTPPRTADLITRRIAAVYVSWVDSHVALDEDTIEDIQVDKLQSVGEVLALALTRMVRQTRY